MSAFLFVVGSDPEEGWYKPEPKNHTPERMWNAQGGMV